MRIWFEGRFEGGLRLSFKGLQTNLDIGIVNATTSRSLWLGLKVGFYQFEHTLSNKNSNCVSIKSKKTKYIYTCLK